VRCRGFGRKRDSGDVKSRICNGNHVAPSSARALIRMRRSAGREEGSFAGN
jgi:hypothetical protein